MSGMASLAEQSEDFKRRVIHSDVVDPEGTHHEFNQGLHGRKVDFDAIEEDDPLFEAWVSVVARFIDDRYERPPDALVGVANGTNRLAEPVAARLGGVIFLETEKAGQPRPALTAAAGLLVKEFKPVFALVVEDVGTVGTNAAAAAQSALEAGVQRAEVLNTLRRSPTLPLLDEAGIAHRSIIEHLLPSYTAEECQQSGLCAAGWELVPYGKR